MEGNSRRIWKKGASKEEIKQAAIHSYSKNNQVNQQQRRNIPNSKDQDHQEETLEVNTSKSADQTDQPKNMIAKEFFQRFFKYDFMLKSHLSIELWVNC